MKVPDGFDLMFLDWRASRVSHYVAWGQGSGYPTSLCGRSPGLFYSWLGTGNQKEYDSAQARVLCSECARLLGGSHGQATDR
jgi:hypothetical protein